MLPSGLRLLAAAAVLACWHAPHFANAIITDAVTIQASIFVEDGNGYVSVLCVGQQALSCGRHRREYLTAAWPDGEV